jgi:type I restriction enzyme S subunit
MSEVDFLTRFTATSLWPTAPAKHLFQCRKETNIGMKEGRRLALTMGGVIDRSLDDNEGLQSSDYTSYQIFNEGDLAFKLIDLQNIKTSRVGLVPCRGIMSPAYIRLVRRSEDTRSSFYYWYFYAAYLNNIFNGLGGGIRQNLNQEDLLQIPVPMISHQDQETIASYLDRETCRIDDLIQEKSGFISLLREKRVAEISQAVTKGINPDALMKSSGVDWLGDLPAHWDAVPANWLFQPSKKLAIEGDQLLSATQKYGVIPLAEFEELAGRKVTLALTNLEKRKHVEVGEFVISMRSMDGGLERARARGSVRSSYIVLKFTDEVDGRFYAYLLKANLFIQALRLTANFIRDGQDMHFGHFRAVKLPRLPLVEQATIADYLDRETTRIDGLIHETEHSIALLKEKRAALITAAVTGKIDVRSAA